MKSGLMCVSDLYKIQSLSRVTGLNESYLIHVIYRNKYNFTLHKCCNSALRIISSEYHNILENDYFDIDAVLNVGAFPYLKKRLRERSKSVTAKRQSAYVEYFINKNDSAKESTSEVLLDIMNLTDRYIFNNRERL